MPKKTRIHRSFLRTEGDSDTQAELVLAYLKASALHEAARVQLERKDTQSAVLLCERALALVARELPAINGDSYAQLRWYRGYLENTLADMFDQQGDESRALAARQRAIANFEAVRRWRWRRPDAKVLGFVHFGLVRAHQEIARIQVHKARFEAAIVAHRKAAFAARAYFEHEAEASNAQLFCRAMKGLGDAQVKAGRSRAAISTYKELVSFCDTVHGTGLLGIMDVAEARARLAWAYYDSGDAAGARRAYQSVLSMKGRAEDVPAEDASAFWVLIGEAHHNTSQTGGIQQLQAIEQLGAAIAAFDRAIEAYSEDFDLFRRKAASTFTLARYHSKIDPKEADRLFLVSRSILDDALQQFPRNEDLVCCQAQALTFQALFEGVTHGYDRAVPLLQKSTALYRQLRESEPDEPELAYDEADALNLLGDALVWTEQALLALEPLKRALECIAVALRCDRTNKKYLATFEHITRRFVQKITIDDLLSPDYE